MVLVNPNHLLHMLSRFVALQSQHLLHAYRLRCAWRTRRGMLIALWRRPWFWAQPTRLWQQAEVCALLVACSARLTRWSRFCLLVSRIDKEFVCSSYALIKSLSARLTHWSRVCLLVSRIDQDLVSLSHALIKAFAVMTLGHTLSHPFSQSHALRFYDTLFLLLAAYALSSLCLP